MTKFTVKKIYERNFKIILPRICRTGQLVANWCRFSHLESPSGSNDEGSGYLSRILVDAGTPRHSKAGPSAQRIRASAVASNQRFSREDGL